MVSRLVRLHLIDPELWPWWIKRFGVTYKEQKLITRREYLNVTSYLFTYLRLSIDIHRTGSSPIRHKVNVIQLNTFEFELDFAQYIQYTDVRITDICWAPTIYRVTSYLRLLALSILTRSPNMSFLARCVSDNSRSLEKLNWGTVLFAHPVRKTFLNGIWVLSVRFDLSSSINFRNINGFPKIGAQNPY